MARERTETKNNILTAARTLFSFHGYNSTALEDILNAAGVSKGAFYHHFRSKEQLCQDVVEKVWEEYKQLAESAYHESEPVEQLRSWLMRLIEQHRLGQWVNCRFITRLSVETGQLGPELQSLIHLFWQWYEEFYEELLVRCGLDREQQAPCAARLLTSTMFGAMWLEQACPSAHTLEEIADSLIRAVLTVQRSRLVPAGHSLHV
jgi:TetR/AcrR family transcriptional repressor of nem operon